MEQFPPPLLQKPRRAQHFKELTPEVSPAKDPWALRSFPVHTARQFEPLSPPATRELVGEEKPNKMGTFSSTSDFQAL